MCCLSLPSLSLGFDDGIIGGNRGVRLLPTGEIKKGKELGGENETRPLL